MAQYGGGQPGPPNGRDGMRKDIASALMIVAGFVLVLIAAWLADPRLAIAIVGFALGGVGVALGFERW